MSPQGKEGKPQARQISNRELSRDHVEMWNALKRIENKIDTLFQALMREDVPKEGSL